MAAIFRLHPHLTPREEPVARWAPAGDDAAVAISTEFVSGRRITTAYQMMRR